MNRVGTFAGDTQVEITPQADALEQEWNGGALSLLGGFRSLGFA